MTEMVAELIASYIDTSAYLAILLGETSAHQLSQALKGHSLCSSTLLFLEAERNSVRLAREGLLSAADLVKVREHMRNDASLFALKEPGLELCLNNQFPSVSTPRSLDLIHIRTALWFAQNLRLDRFMTLDQSQRFAAQEMGLPVWRK